MITAEPDEAIVRQESIIESTTISPYDVSPPSSKQSINFVVTL